MLSLGTLEPRKNLARLVEAMESIWDRRPEFPDLVLAGAEGWGLRGPRRAAARPRGTPRASGAAGYLAGDERARWMAGARVFAYPSLYEGFGLPPLEAMALGTPVVASSAASLPEVLGDAGLLPDPRRRRRDRRRDRARPGRRGVPAGRRREGPGAGRDVHLGVRRPEDAHPVRGGALVTRLRVLVDARKVRDFGIGSYIRGLLGGLVRQDRWDLCATVHPGDDVLLPAGVAPVACDAPHYTVAELFAVRGAIARLGARRLPRPALRRPRAAARRDRRHDPRPHAPEPARARRALETRLREVDGRPRDAPLGARDRGVGGDEEGNPGFRTRAGRQGRRDSERRQRRFLRVGKEGGGCAASEAARVRPPRPRRAPAPRRPTCGGLVPIPFQRKSLLIFSSSETTSRTRTSTASSARGRTCAPRTRASRSSSRESSPERARCPRARRPSGSCRTRTCPRSSRSPRRSSSVLRGGLRPPRPRGARGRDARRLLGPPRAARGGGRGGGVLQPARRRDDRERAERAARG